MHGHSILPLAAPLFLSLPLHLSLYTMLSTRRVLSRFFSSAVYKVPDAAKLSFREKGYAVLPGFLSEQEILPIEAIYNKFMAGDVPIPGKDFCDMSQTFEAIKGKHPNDWQIVNAMLPRKYYPALANNVYEQRAADAAAQLFPFSKMALDYDQLLNKRPGKAKAIFAWHQDMAYWPGRNLTPDTRTVTFSLAVDATTRENGALKFWTGSNTGELHPHKPMSTSRDDAHAIAVEVDESKVPIEMLCVNRGDVTIHDEWVVHGSGGNLSKGTRRTYVIAFRTADTVGRERKAGFTHSHQDTVNWDSFNPDKVG